MNKNALHYLLALLVCLAVGCCAALLLRGIDAAQESIAPLSGGKTLELPACGMRLQIPSGAETLDMLGGQSAPDGTLLSLAVSWDDHLLRIYAFINEDGDDIADYSAQTLVTQYTQSGAEGVRLRTFGGRRFMQYSASSDAEEAAQLTRFATWNSDIFLMLETESDAGDVLPILASITF